MIRLLRADEIEQAAPLGKAFFEAAKLPGEFSPTKFVRGWQRVIMADAGVILGLFEDNVLRGGIGAYITPDSMTEDVVAYEAFFYVDPVFRGKGGELMPGLESVLKLKGVTRFWMVHLNDERAPAMRRYYERKGFTLREFLYSKNLK